MFDPATFSSAFAIGESEPAPEPEPEPEPTTENPIPQPVRAHRIIRHQAGPLKITRIRSRE